MAEPRISGIEVHTYTYTLEELAKDYNGFNLMYAPGSTVTQTGHIIRILTDVGWSASMPAAVRPTMPSCRRLSIT